MVNVDFSTPRPSTVEASVSYLLYVLPFPWGSARRAPPNPGLAPPAMAREAALGRGLTDPHIPGPPGHRQQGPCGQSVACGPLGAPESHKQVE